MLRAINALTLSGLLSVEWATIDAAERGSFGRAIALPATGVAVTGDHRPHRLRQPGPTRILRGMPNHWLFKSEPDVYGIDRLEREGRTEWSGVRNFQARNFMREMKLGDLGFFYHSSTKPPGIAGILKVIREAYPDFTQFERGHEYEDPTSKPERPKWWMVDVGFVRKFDALIPLDELRAQEALAGMPLLRRGQRLSVQPVSDEHWDAIVALAGRTRVGHVS